MTGTYRESDTASDSIEDAAFTYIIGAPLTRHLLPATPAAGDADRSAEMGD